jgi:cytochrome c-type biogenesis protein CcmH
MEAPVEAGKTVSGKIVLPAARRNDVKRGDTLFVIARKAGGMGGAPLAVQKLQAGDFPMDFSLSSRDAMVQGIPFEGDIAIMVRVDKDGDAMTRRKGDVMGQVPLVKVGKQDVVIPLDTLQTEDVTLGGGMMPGGARPGLPPGHP